MQKNEVLASYIRIIGSTMVDIGKESFEKFQVLYVCVYICLSI